MCIIIIQVLQLRVTTVRMQVKGLGKLGYAKGNVKEEEHTIRYHQPTLWRKIFLKFW